MKRKRLKLSSCQNCEDGDSMEMVACDGCDKWSHFACVGVGPEVADEEWFCDSCKNILGELELIKKEVKQQESKYVLLLKEYEQAKCEITRIDAAYRSNLDEMKALLDDRTAKSTDAINSEKLALAGQLKNVLDDNQRMRADLDRISLKQTQSLNKPNEHEDTKLARMDAAFQSKLDDMQKLFDEQNVKYAAMQFENLSLAGELKSIRDDNHRMRIDIDNISQTTSKSFNKSAAIANDLKMSDDERAIWVYNKLPCLHLQELKVFGTELLNPKIFIALQNYMQLYGGNVNKFISHMINKIACKELQSKLSYSGHRTTNDALTSFPTVVNLLHISAKAKFSGYDTDTGVKIISGLLKQT